MTPAEFDARIQRRFAKCIRDRDDLRQYQESGLTFMRENPMSLLALDMGLGKTVTSGTLIAELVADKFFRPGEKVLIAAPLRVATETWPTEFESWRHMAWMSRTLVHVFDDDPELKRAEAMARTECRARGLALNSAEAKELIRLSVSGMRDQLRRSLAREDTQVHIIAMHWLEWLVELHGRNWPYRTVFVDESSMLKDQTSDRFRALKNVRNAKQNLIDRMHLLTATPAAEGYMGLFSQIWLLDRGERLGKTITKYREDYFKHNSYTHKYTLREGAEEKILAKISDVSLVMKAKDYLPDIHEPLIVQRHVHLTPRQMDMYREMEREFVVTLDDGTEVEAETAAALSQKLLQMASGVLYETVETPPDDWADADESTLQKVRKVHSIHNHKIDLLKEIFEQAQGEPLLVAYYHRSSLDRLKKAFPRAVQLDRDGRAIKPWNQRKIPMLLIHPASGGHGLNLQHGGHNLVFFDLPWSLEQFIQLIGRLARSGQTHPVVVQILLALGTLDEVVLHALFDKQDGMAKMLNSLARMIRKFRQKKACVDDEL